MSRDHLIQIVGMLILMGVIVYGITVIMDMSRAVDNIGNKIEADTERVRVLEESISRLDLEFKRHEAENDLRFTQVEKRNEEDAVINDIVLKMSGKFDALERQINTLLTKLEPNKGDAQD